jgi:polyisoprenoid-binding protein YceI
MATESFDIDISHSSVGFTVRHLVISKVHGQFTKWSGSIAFDSANYSASKVEVSIDAASIDTRDEKRDGHLKSPDFFDVEKFPTLTFKSTKVEGSGETVKVHGELTIHGVTKSVVLDGEYVGRGKDPWGGERIGFTAKTKIDRKDFGLGWNQALEAGGVLVGENIDITLEVQAKKALSTAKQGWRAPALKSSRHRP